jgi:hypothetical protein
MNSRLADINERARQRDLDDPRAEPPLHPSELGRLGHWSIVRRVPAVLGRAVIAFCVGVTATLVWQSYGNTARRMVASLNPRLAWLAPVAAPAVSGATAPGPSAGVPPDQLAAISHSLAAVRQSVDKLAADITKLQAAKQDVPPVRTSASPAAAVAQGRKPASAAPTQAATTR